MIGSILDFKDSITIKILKKMNVDPIVILVVIESENTSNKHNASDEFLLQYYNINFNYFHGGKIRMYGIFNDENVIVKVTIDNSDALNKQYLKTLCEKLKKHYFGNNTKIIFLKTKSSYIMENNIKNEFENTFENIIIVDTTNPLITRNDIINLIK